MFVSTAAVTAAAPAATLANAPMAPVAATEPDPIFALISRHRAEEKAYTDALVARDEFFEIAPEECRRRRRVQIGMKDGKPYYVHTHEAIDARLEFMPDFASTPEIRARLHAELDRDTAVIEAKWEESGLCEANERADELCDSCLELEWALATTPPTSIAGAAALLRYVNEVEDGGEEWPDSDCIGREGWHYQLRQTIAAAVVNLI